MFNLDCKPPPLNEHDIMSQLSSGFRRSSFERCRCRHPFTISLFFFFLKMAFAPSIVLSRSHTGLRPSFSPRVPVEGYPTRARTRRATVAVATTEDAPLKLTYFDMRVRDTHHSQKRRHSVASERVGDEHTD